MGDRGAKSGFKKRSIKTIEPGNENDEASRYASRAFPGLSEYPLVYGDDDPTLSDTVRRAVTAFESRYYRRPEICLIVDKNGKAIDFIRGGETQADIPEESLQKAAVFTHTHARTEGEGLVIGGTFSIADLNAWADTNCRTFRAAAAEGTYSISKMPGFSKAAKVYFAEADRECNRHWRAKQDEINRIYRSGKISKEQYRHDSAKAENQLYAEFHNKIIEGAKKYGYVYRLEKG